MRPKPPGHADATAQDIGRRELLKWAAGLGTASGLPLAASAAPASTPPSWSQVRQMFRLQGQAPLNAANLCPAFAEVLDQHGHFAEKLNADVGFLNRREFVKQELAAARTACAALLGLRDADSVAFVRNTTEANAAIVNGLALQAEDEVLLWRENHASNYRSWHYRHLRQPMQVRSFALPQRLESPAQIAAAIVAELRPNTRVLSFSHLSNISGTRLPAQEICAAVHAVNADLFIHIDGAQTWGSQVVDLDAIDCDSYASSGHKWLCGPRGTGILMLRRRWAERITPSILGYDFNFDYPEDRLQANALRLENLGQRDTAAYGALGVAARRHLALGPARIEARISALTQYALTALDRAGIACITPRDPRFGHGVVVANLGSRLKSYGAFLALHNAGYAAAFIHGNRVHCSPEGPVSEDDLPVYLRICPHLYNDEKDIDAAVAVASRIRDSNFEIIKEMVRFF